MIALVLLCIALICFGLAALNVASPVNLVALGLFFALLAMLITSVAIPRVR